MFSKEAFQNYLTGVPEMDKDHTEIVVGMNKFQSLYAQGELVRAKELLLQLKVLMQAHFSREEAWMREIGFKFVGYHTQLHGEYIITFERFISSCGRNFYVPNIDDGLIQPFKAHIEKDRVDYSVPYQEWLAKNGGK